MGYPGSGGTPCGSADQYPGTPGLRQAALVAECFWTWSSLPDILHCCNAREFPQTIGGATLTWSDALAADGFHSRGDTPCARRTRRSIEAMPKLESTGDIPVREASQPLKRSMVGSGPQ